MCRSWPTLRSNIARMSAHWGWFYFNHLLIFMLTININFSRAILNQHGSTAFIPSRESEKIRFLFNSWRGLGRSMSNKGSQSYQLNLNLRRAKAAFGRFLDACWVRYDIQVAVHNKVRWLFKRNICNFFSSSSRSYQAKTIRCSSQFWTMITFLHSMRRNPTWLCCEYFVCASVNGCLGHLKLSSSVQQKVWWCRLIMVRFI